MAAPHHTIGKARFPTAHRLARQPALGLPAGISGQNELFPQARPPDRPVTLLAVGGGALRRAEQNSSCKVLVRLDNGVGVPNEEQGQPVAVCRDAREPWQAVWPQFRHLD
jgi:hypothetical protein